MNTKYKTTRLVSITLLCFISMVLHAASVVPAGKNRQTSISGAGSLSISGTGGIATRAFTGIWNQPSHSSQSTVIQMVNNDSGGLNAIVYWLAFDDNSIPLWFFAEGPVTTNRIDLTIFVATDPANINPVNAVVSNLQERGSGFEVNDGNLQVWGTGSIEFDNCIDGTFSGTRSISGTGGFSFPIKKVASVADTRCTGGLSDSVNPWDSPVDINAFFTATTVGAGSSGKTEFEISAGRTKIEVEIEGLPAGDYGLSIDGVNHGSIQVLSTTSGSNKGKIVFSSPVESGKQLLTFDPRGKLIEVTNSSSSVVLTLLFPPVSATDNLGPAGGSELEIRIDMTNAGIYPTGDAKAEFEQRPDRSEFSVELENIPVGDYDLFVGSVFRGIITVIEVSGGTEGEIEFRNPLETGKVPLDFDPRNQLIEVMEGTTLLFSGNLAPNNAIGSNNGSIELAFNLQNSGIDANASGSLEYEKNVTETRIEVDIEDLSEDGSYDVFFEGTLKGIITVVDGKGRWRFRSPRDGSTDPFLDFDPFGATVSVRLSGVEILYVRIPD